ncbi:MAG: serine hydrolase, partial [Bacilli bacterium]
MKKIIILLSFFLCLGSVNAFDLKSKNAILYNLDNNTVLYELQPDQEIYIASLTKIMTSIVAIEQINDLNNKIVIKDVMLDGLIEQDASMAGFEVGDVVSYKDLLYALLLPSGADAAYSLAYSLVGSEKEFVKLMNDKAQQLGLKNTHYVNITGLDIDNHYSTVRDISILLKYALTNETFKKIYTTTYYTTSNGLNLKSSLQYYFDKFDIEADYIIGSKTGSTDEAGYCLSSIANYNNINYLLITAGADYEEKLPNHIIDSKQIYEYYFGHYDNINIVNNKQIITTIKTKNSKEKEYNIIAPKTITYYLNK